jgi:hypothetical protein
VVRVYYSFPKCRFATQMIANSANR